MHKNVVGTHGVAAPLANDFFIQQVTEYPGRSGLRIIRSVPSVGNSGGQIWMGGGNAETWYGYRDSWDRHPIPDDPTSPTSRTYLTDTYSPKSLTDLHRLTPKKCVQCSGSPCLLITMEGSCLGMCDGTCNLVPRVMVTSGIDGRSIPDAYILFPDSFPRLAWTREECTSHISPDDLNIVRLVTIVGPRHRHVPLCHVYLGATLATSLLLVVYHWAHAADLPCSARRQLGTSSIAWPPRSSPLISKETTETRTVNPPWESETLRGIIVE